MTEKFNIELKSFETKINQNGKISFPEKELKLLREAGFRNVTVRIFGSSEEALRKHGLDIRLFKEIKEKQSLPDEVVFELLRSRGSITDYEFPGRIF